MPFLKRRGVKMFEPILHNTENPKIRAYNVLIGQKPKSGSLEQKIIAQREWRDQCYYLLAEIKDDLKGTV